MFPGLPKRARMEWAVAQSYVSRLTRDRSLLSTSKGGRVAVRRVFRRRRSSIEDATGRPDSDCTRRLLLFDIGHSWEKRIVPFSSLWGGPHRQLQASPVAQSAVSGLAAPRKALGPPSIRRPARSRRFRYCHGEHQPASNLSSSFVAHPAKHRHRVRFVTRGLFPTVTAINHNPEPASPLARAGACVAQVAMETAMGMAVARRRKWRAQSSPMMIYKMRG